MNMLFDRSSSLKKEAVREANRPETSDWICGHGSVKKWIEEGIRMGKRWKIAVAFILLVLESTLFVACGSTASIEDWTVEDVAFYNEKGENFVTSEARRELLLSDMNEKYWGSLKTKRGVHIGDWAAALLNNYDLSNFHFTTTYSYKNNNSDEELEFGKQFLEK